jgi:hypothetical protein
VQLPGFSRGILQLQRRRGTAEQREPGSERGGGGAFPDRSPVRPAGSASS